MNAWAGLLILIAYLVGESKGWGEWAAELKYVKTNLSPQELYELVSKV